MTHNTTQHTTHRATYNIARKFTLKPTLNDAFSAKSNSFDFLRFFLAFTVIVTHGFWLGGFGYDPMDTFTQGQVSIGPVAVAGFFVLSGFLITRSTQRSSLWRFLWHRCLRILPGFWACLLVTVLLFAPLMYWLSFGNISGYWQTSPTPLDYLKANFLLRARLDRIGNLFEHAGLFPYYINGSLWTLYNEFKCYIAIGVLAALGCTRDRRSVILLITAVLVVVYIEEYFTGQFLRQHLPFFLENFFFEHLTYFFVGASAYLFADKVPIRADLFVVCCLAWFAGAYWQVYFPVAILTLPYMLLWLVVKLPIPHWGKYGDYSYGLYLYAFPIQRILNLTGVPKLGVWPYIAITTVITLVFAVLSYRLIESPLLRMKDVQIKQSWLSRIKNLSQ